MELCCVSVEVPFCSFPLDLKTHAPSGLDTTTRNCDFSLTVCQCLLSNKQGVHLHMYLTVKVFKIRKQLGQPDARQVLEVTNAYYHVVHLILSRLLLVPEARCLSTLRTQTHP